MKLNEPKRLDKENNRLLGTALPMDLDEHAPFEYGETLLVELWSSPLHAALNLEADARAVHAVTCTRRRGIPYR